MTQQTIPNHTCGCLTKRYGAEIVRCPLHEAAPELLEKGNRVIAAWLKATPGGNIAEISPQLGELRAAIAQAETI